MNAEDFNKIVAARMAWCNKTLCAKGDEYARYGDRLWNFKAAGRKRNQHPAQALAGMEVKHDVSVDDIIDGLAQGIVPPKEMVAEKIGDSINYLLLLEGLIEEERANQPVPDPEPWQTAVSEHTRRREQAATSAHRREAMDALGYTIPLPQDGDDDPAVHVVPDRTSRNWSQPRVVPHDDGPPEGLESTPDVVVGGRVAASEQNKETIRAMTPMEFFNYALARKEAEAPEDWQPCGND